MNSDFQIDSRHSAGNLHINLIGHFNSMCAWQLFKMLKQHNGAGRVFVRTDGISEVIGDGVQLFRSYMSRRRLPKDWLYFKGQKGFQIAPDGSRVLVCHKGTPTPTRRSRQSPPTIALMKHNNNVSVISG